jgi:uncharacterized membrane protein
MPTAAADPVAALSADGVRLQSIDVYRGIAILAMAAYHASWDLNYFGLISVGIGVDPLWMGLQRGIVTAFVLLAGASLWLAHRTRIDWVRFWRREAILIAAAAGVSAVTWFQFGDYLAYFGILHAIALFSLMALPFLRLPATVVTFVALVVLLLPAAFSGHAFNPRWVSWIGFFTATPPTADLVPVFPWFGVTLLGIAGMRLAATSPAVTWSSGNPIVRALAQLGRWSLVIYLVHQPILFAIISWLAAHTG